MELKEVKQYALEVSSSYSERNKINTEMEKLYWMQWDEEEAVSREIGDIAKKTRSPRAANALDGMLRLLCASDPIFSVPNELNAPFTKGSSEKMEKFSSAMWAAAGMISGKPLHYEVVRSALLYDEVHIALNSTKDLLEASKGGAREKRAEEISQRTPFLYKVTNPSDGYPIWDEIGLTFFYSKRKVRHIDVETMFGSKGKAVIRRLEGGNPTPYKMVVLHSAYDLENRYIWVEGSDQEIITAAHGYPFIPIVATKVEGSDLFSKPEMQRRPALYNLYKSGIIERQNLFLTVMYTMVFALGSNPMFVEYLLNPQNPPQVDFSNVGGTIRMRTGERREPMAKQILDPALMQSWEIAQQLEMESTIYRQTLGEPLGANAPYSMVALLSQSGRLPLLLPQRMSGFAIGKAAELSLKIAKKDGVVSAVNSSGIYAIMEPDDIPEFFEMFAKLDIAMPQDLLNNVNAAVMGTQGQNPLFTKAWAQENLLQIGQPEEMQRAVWTEQLDGIFYQQFVQRMMKQLEQEMNPPQPETPPTGPPMGGPPMGGPPMGGPPPGPVPPNGGGPNAMGTPTLSTPSRPFPNQPSPYEPAQPMIPPDQGVPGQGVG